MLDKITNNASPRSVSKTPRGVSQIKDVGFDKRSGTPTSKTNSTLKLGASKKPNSYELPLYAYAWPTQLNPLYEHLNNLCPASESTCTFF